jgi:hypothetical protein
MRPCKRRLQLVRRGGRIKRAITGSYSAWLLRSTVLQSPAPPQQGLHACQPLR